MGSNKQLTTTTTNLFRRKNKTRNSLSAFGKTSKNIPNAPSFHFTHTFTERRKSVWQSQSEDESAKINRNEKSNWKKWKCSRRKKWKGIDAFFCCFVVKWCAILRSNYLFFYYIKLHWASQVGRRHRRQWASVLLLLYTTMWWWRQYDSMCRSLFRFLFLLYWMT